MMPHPGDAVLAVVIVVLLVLWKFCGWVVR